MDGVLDRFHEAASGLAYRPPRIRLLSNLTGGPASAEQVCTPEYWVRHIREAVRFHDGLLRMAADGVTTFLELGPGGVLSALVRDALADRSPAPAAVPLLRRGRPEADSALTALAGAHVRGVPVDWAAVLADSGEGRVALPTYAFQRRRFWPEGVTPAARPAERTTEVPTAEAPTAAPGDTRTPEAETSERPQDGCPPSARPNAARSSASWWPQKWPPRSVTPRPRTWRPVSACPSWGSTPSPRPS